MHGRVRYCSVEGRGGGRSDGVEKLCSYFKYDATAIMVLFDWYGYHIS